MSGCPHFGPCGGCRFLDTDYAAQLPAKHAQVVAALAGHALLRAAAVRPVLADPEPFCYRNKAIYPVQ
ncbi:MAG: 23S rRNA (uracil-5-)-methyltransferase RumA, partial [Planctomycetota bacterium]